MQYGKIYSVAGNVFKQVNLFRNFSFVICLLDLFGNFSFRTGCLKMRCSKSCYLRDLELVDLFDNRVIEQVYYINVSEFEWQFFDLFKVPPSAVPSRCLFRNRYGYFWIRFSFFIQFAYIFL